MESLGKLLKDIRAKRSLTQTQAAEAIGIEQSYLSKLESDQAWASLEVLRRICKQYNIDVKTLLGQVDQDSLRGNLQYQGFLQRNAEQSRRAWGIAAALIVISTVTIWFVLDVKPSSSVVNLTHTPVSLTLEQVSGRDVLKMIADYGGLTIMGINKVEGEISYLQIKNKPWDIALATVAAELGYRIEISGAVVELIPVKKLFRADGNF